MGYVSISEMFDGQIYLDELFRYHDVAAEMPEKSHPPFSYEETWPGF